MDLLRLKDCNHRDNLIDVGYRQSDVFRRLRKGGIGYCGSSSVREEA